MINFSPLRTKRLSVKLKEISMIDAIRLCSIPQDNHEAATSEFLQCVIASAETPSAKHVSDPRSWTVQERMFTVGHYLAHVGDTPDFELAGESRYSDYIMHGKDVGAFPVEVGEVGDDHWSISPLIGASAEAIERLTGDIAGATGRFHWLCGCMAAQMTMKDEEEEIPDPIIDFNVYLVWLEKRMTTIAHFPESQWVQLLGLYLEGSQKVEHLFNIDVDSVGLLAKQIHNTEAGATELPSARFPVSTLVSEVAIRFGGKPRAPSL